MEVSWRVVQFVRERSFRKRGCFERDRERGPFESRLAGRKVVSREVVSREERDVFRTRERRRIGCERKGQNRHTHTDTHREVVSREGERERGRLFREIVRERSFRETERLTDSR